LKPSIEQIRQWKEEYGSVYTIGFEGAGNLEVYYRVLKLGEFAFLEDKEFTPELQYYVVEKCVLFPKDFPIGMVQQLADTIIQSSKWLSKEAMESALAIEMDIFTEWKAQMMYLLHFKIEDINKLEFDKFFEYVRMCRVLLNGGQQEQPQPQPQQRPLTRGGRGAKMEIETESSRTFTR
jgi:hypothetical protein